MEPLLIGHPRGTKKWPLNKGLGAGMNVTLFEYNTVVAFQPKQLNYTIIYTNWQLITVINPINKMNKIEMYSNKRKLYTLAIKLFLAIRHFHIVHNALCLPSNILHKHCFQFLLGLTIFSREIEINACAKVHYG